MGSCREDTLEVADPRCTAGSTLRSTESRPVEIYNVSKHEDSCDFRLSGYYHQQYLAKNSDGYCGIGGCGVPFKLVKLPVGEKT